MKFIDQKKRIVQLDDDEDVWSTAYIVWVHEMMGWYKLPWYQRWFTPQPEIRIEQP